ncbi:MAG: N-acetylglucosamine-6-phosphate deacetylase [Sphingomonadaceae bacterium]
MAELIGRLPVKGGGFEGIRLRIQGDCITAVERLPQADHSMPILSPGWIDLQCNGALGQDFGDPAADFGAVPGYLAETGVTGYLATVITAAPESYPLILDHLKSLKGLPGAHFLGVHLEGPFLNVDYRGAHNPDWIRGFSEPLVRSLAVEPVRLVTLAPELEGGPAACLRFLERGIVPSIGHSGASYEEACAAFAAGVGAGTHLFNAMPPLHHRAPGLAGALLERSAPPVGLIVDGRHLHPAVVRLAWEARGPEGIFLVTDAVPAVGLPPGEYTLSGQRMRVDGNAARLEDGRLAGSLLRMNQAVANLAAWTGDLWGALRAASETPARVIGLSICKGKLEAGYDADLVLLDDDLNVLETIVGGRTVYRA